MAGSMQEIASTGWGFSERERLGAWELRAAGGFTSRANCVWPLGDPGKPLSEALDDAVRWYAARDLKPRIQTITDTDLDRAIAELGFTTTDSPALRQTADVGTALEILTATTDPERKAEISVELPKDFLTVYRRGLGHASATAVLTNGDAEHRFAVVRDGEGAALAVGRLATSTLATNAKERWSGLSAIHTAAHARRQGLAHVILRDLLAAASAAGADSAYLEVEDDNVPARACYESIGFATHHSYHCRVLL